MAVTSAIAGAVPVMAAPSQRARPLAVSVPPEPTPAPKGATARMLIRVLNPGSEAVTVTVAQRQVLLASDGQVSMGAIADPEWQGRVQFMPDTATVGPQQFVDVVITVDVPPTLTSDLHFVGFLVSPVATVPGRVTVINQIGSFVTLDVPGPRVALLRATLRMPGFKLGRQAVGGLKVANVGQSSVRFWGESDTTSWPAGGTPKQQRFQKSLVPIGATRSLRVSARPAWPVGFVTIRGQVIYPSTTASATTGIPFSRRVLVIDPRAIAVLVGVLVLAFLGWWLRHRRHRPLQHSRTAPTPAR